MHERLLEHFITGNCKTYKRPSQAGLDGSKDTGDIFTDETPYRHLISALINLANTVRPDTAFAVDYLSRLLQSLRHSFGKLGSMFSAT